MGSPVVVEADTSRMVALSGALKRAGSAARPVVAMALNRTISMARTQVVRHTTAQTGLPRRTIVKAVKRGLATAASLMAKLESRGGDVRLKFFKPRESAAGVVATSGVYAGAFMRGGRFPNRVAFSRAGMRGNVFKRTGSKRLPIEVERSGVFIPEEMISGGSLAAFHSVAERVLPERTAHELGRILPGR